MSIQVREGGRYRLADGEVVGPMIRCVGPFSSTLYPWVHRTESGPRFYSDNGRRFGDRRPRIVEELPDETSPVEAAIPTHPDDYAVLRGILDDAFEQAASGKGKERHARGQRFEDQPILTIAQEEGPAFLTGQAKKKITEARGMVERRQFGAAERELLGAINYLAARIHLLRQEKGAGA